MYKKVYTTHYYIKKERHKNVPMSSFYSASLLLVQMLALFGVQRYKIF